MKSQKKYNMVHIANSRLAPSLQRCGKMRRSKSNITLDGRHITLNHEKFATKCKDLSISTLSQLHFSPQILKEHVNLALATRIPCYVFLLSKWTKTKKNSILMAEIQHLISYGIQKQIPGPTLITH